MSAATLSRVERDKQTIDVALFLTLARILNTAPADLLDNADDSDGALAARIGAMESRDRTALWRQISEQRRDHRLRKRADMQNMALEVEELLAQMDFLRDEIEGVRVRLARRR